MVLALRAQRGDTSAFEEIYDRHAPGIARALAAFAGPDRDTLDDLTQDVFFRVIKGLMSYTPSHPFAHWLYTIALNVGRNHARRTSRVIPVSPARLDEIAGVHSHPSEWADDVTTDTLWRLASGLPEPIREVIALRAGSEMSYGEIADVLGIPEGTARSRMFNGIKILRDQLRIGHQKRSSNNDG